MDYTVEEVRAMASDLRAAPGTSMIGTHISLPTERAVAIYEALCAYAERIKADEGAVPVATDAQVEAIIKSVHSGYGIDESSWSQLLVRAALESKAVAQPLPMGKDGDGVVPALWIEFTDDGQNIRLWTRNGQQAAEEIREGRKLLAFYARPPSQAMNEQSGISGQLEFRKGLLEGLSMAKSECDNRVFALDGGDNQFRREATASQCAEAIRLVYARMFREMTAMPATRPPAQSAQAALSEALNALEDAAVNGHKLLGDDALRFRALADRIAPTTEPVAQGEVVAEVYAGAFGIHYIACADPNKLPVGTKLFTHPHSPDAADSGRVDIWRCFHCDEVFTDAESATEHFGASERHNPACQIGIAEYRAMEYRMMRYNDEDADIHRQMHRMGSGHQQALHRAEEDGYAKGLAALAAQGQSAASPVGVPDGNVIVTGFLPKSRVVELRFDSALPAWICEPGAHVTVAAAPSAMPEGGEVE